MRNGAESRVALAGIPAPEHSPPRSKLTLRGRLLLTVLAGILPFAAFTAGRASAGADSPPPPRSVVVEPGQTLWDLAGSLERDSDVGQTVADLMELNDLTSGVLQPGQELALPPGARPA